MAGVDFSVLSARAERERQGTLLALTLSGGSHMSGNTLGARTRAPFRARSGREA